MDKERAIKIEMDYIYMPYRNEIGDSGDYIFDLIVYL